MSAIGSLFGGGHTPAPPQVSTFQPPGMGEAAANTTGNIQDFSGVSQGLLSQYFPFMNQQIAANTQGGNMGAQAAWSTIPGATNVGMGSIGGAQNLQGAGGAILGQAFDPQRDLFNKLFQQNQDVTNVTNSMYGVQNTPYGAGVANDANRNFILDWQNRQLGRELAGVQGAEGAFGAAQPLANAGQAGVVGSAMLPFATLSGAAGANTQAIGAGTQETQQTYQPTISDLLSYLGWGTNQINAFNTGQIGAYGAATGRQQAQTAQQKLGFEELGSLLGAGAGIAGMLPMPSMSGLSSAPTIVGGSF